MKRQIKRNSINWFGLENYAMQSSVSSKVWSTGWDHRVKKIKVAN